MLFHEPYISVKYSMGHNGKVFSYCVLWPKHLRAPGLEQGLTLDKNSINIYLLGKGMNERKGEGLVMTKQVRREVRRLRQRQQGGGQLTY